MAIKQSIEDKLQESFKRWQTLYKTGGSDPFWSDGFNLFLVRNHIISYKRQIEEACLDGNYPDVYYQETPPEVDKDYMAQAESIKEKAENSLIICKNDSNYNLLLFVISKLTKEIKKQTSIDNVIGYVSSLEHAISQNN